MNKSNTINKQKTAYPIHKNTTGIIKSHELPGTLIYEDPAEILNISDDRWAKIVIENKVKFDQEKLNYKKSQYEKTKAI